MFGAEPNCHRNIGSRRGIFCVAPVVRRGTFSGVFVARRRGAAPHPPESPPRRTALCVLTNTDVSKVDVRGRQMLGRGRRAPRPHFSGEGPAKPEPGGPKGPPKSLKTYDALPVLALCVVQSTPLGERGATQIPTGSAPNMG